MMKRKNLLIYASVPVIVALNWLAVCTALYHSMPVGSGASDYVTRSIGEAFMLALPHGLRAGVVTLGLTLAFMLLVRNNEQE